MTEFVLGLRCKTHTNEIILEFLVSEGSIPRVDWPNLRRPPLASGPHELGDAGWTGLLNENAPLQREDAPIVAQEVQTVMPRSNRLPPPPREVQLSWTHAELVANAEIYDLNPRWIDMAADGDELVHVTYLIRCRVSGCRYNARIRRRALFQVLWWLHARRDRLAAEVAVKQSLGDLPGWEVGHHAMHKDFAAEESRPWTAADQARGYREWLPTPMLTVQWHSFKDDVKALGVLFDSA